MADPPTEETPEPIVPTRLKIREKQKALRDERRAQEEAEERAKDPAS